MDNRERYCFQHNIHFDSDELYQQHSQECSDMLYQINLCKQHANDGSMCGESFATTGELVNHCKDVHNVVICDKCDAQSVDSQKMRSHRHDRKGNKDDIHISKSRHSKIKKVVLIPKFQNQNRTSSLQNLQRIVPIRRSSKAALNDSSAPLGANS